jgi:hypothetical protein
MHINLNFFLIFRRYLATIQKVKRKNKRIEFNKKNRNHEIKIKR